MRGVYYEAPTAMIDTHGNLIRSSQVLGYLTILTYTEILKTLQIKEELKLHKMEREKEKVLEIILIVKEKFSE